MNRFERMFGILLQLYGGHVVTAVELGKRFEVSTRTAYRDLEMLNELGVPIYAERGRFGGFRLLDGYYIPPLMFTRGEAISLLLGLAFVQSISVKPYSDDMESARLKLLSSIPNHLRKILEHADRVIGFESPSKDAFHVENILTPADDPLNNVNGDTEAKAIEVWMQAIFKSAAVRLTYRSPYRNQVEEVYINPLGMFYDRDHWYFVGQNRVESAGPKLWRSDRVQQIEQLHLPTNSQVQFDVRSFLNRNWLQSAMSEWREQAPVKIRMTPAQATRLSQDWYYIHATYEQIGSHTVMMTYGEDNVTTVLELLRWLGPGAELIEPQEWRKIVYEELKSMMKTYDT
ncbi:YafY family protein [Alicyclobacillus sp. SO9]|uniref:helix-turn-helix transcriptional regulator n=1 Tax=Alicyclobacillus sp. SO9 TaxID=2665646 RepID=UPI0018E88352|nr:YafY family protein [Alicyclobacillus sp. SO9]QQE78573.1 YafY family transcriptional regulator [Alicyclobacillus sp. SO9]